MSDKQPFAPVLIKCYADGTIQVFRDSLEVNVQFLDVPDTSELYAIESNDGICAAEVSADEYVDSKVRPTHREVNEPIHMTQHKPECSIAGKMRANLGVQVLRTLRDIGEESARF